MAAIKVSIAVKVLTPRYKKQNPVTPSSVAKSKAEFKANLPVAKGRLRVRSMLDSLPKVAGNLRDPLCEQDQQPAYCKNIHRSIKPQIFVSIGICTHLGCVPTYRPDVGSISPDWLGGFYCPCHGFAGYLSRLSFIDRISQGSQGCT